MFINKIFAFIFVVMFLSQVSFCDETIRGENNAYSHNNKGLIYVREKYYYGAIKEFQMAIDLNPKTQAAATYYVNLGDTYEKIGYPDLARPCFEKAVNLNPLYFNNYLKVAENYKKSGLVDEKLAEFSSKTDSPLNEIFVGLLYIQQGNKSLGITVLDEFCNKEPNLLVTSGVKNYIKEISSDL